MHNGRAQKRLIAGIPVHIHLPDSQQSIAVENQNISWGGALFSTRDPAVLTENNLRITFPWSKGRSFSAEAEVVRRETRQDGSILVAVRFSRMLRADQSRLDRLLHLIDHDEHATTEDGGIPIVEILELDFADDREMHDSLMEIASGRLSLIVFSAYRTEQSILLSLNGSRDLPAIQLRARVIGQEALNSPSIEQHFVKVELQLEHPGEDLRRIAMGRTSPARHPAKAIGVD